MTSVSVKTKLGKFKAYSHKDCDSNCCLNTREATLELKAYNSGSREGLICLMFGVRRAGTNHVMMTSWHLPQASVFLRLSFFWYLGLILKSFFPGKLDFCDN